MDFNRISPLNGQLSLMSALTTGLVPFTLLLLIIDGISGGKLSHVFGLYPLAPFKFELNKLSFYPLYHQNIFHWIFNIVSLVSPLNHFEKSHGTVYTGVTLNLLTVVAGLQYCIVGLFLYRHTYVIGLSGIVFLFMSYYAFKEHEFKPILYQYQYNGRNLVLQTKYLPFVSLILCLILFPGSSFWGHLAGISTGYLLAMGYLNVLYPPLKAIVFIESKLTSLIKLLDGIVNYIPEEEAINLRSVSYTPIFGVDIEGANATTSSVDSSGHAGFRGEGHVLGQN